MMTFFSHIKLSLASSPLCTNNIRWIVNQWIYNIQYKQKRAMSVICFRIDSLVGLIWTVVLVCVCVWVLNINCYTPQSRWIRYIDSFHQCHRYWIEPSSVDSNFSIQANPIKSPWCWSNRIHGTKQTKNTKL